MASPVLLHDNIKDKGGADVIVVPSADDYGVNVIVNIDNYPEVLSAQAGPNLAALSHQKPSLVLFTPALQC